MMIDANAAITLLKKDLKKFQALNEIGTHDHALFVGGFAIPYLGTRMCLKNFLNFVGKQYSITCKEGF